jgi:hypothetical protein
MRRTTFSYVPVAWVLTIVAACAAPAPVEERPPEPESVRAFRYLVEIVTERPDYVDLPEIYLPEQGIVCNVTSEFAPTSDDPLKSRPMARAFAWKGPRNHDRNGQQRSTERYDLPDDLAAQMVALAELTARQRELAAQVGARVAALVPLDSYYEFDELLNEMRNARSRTVDSSVLDDVQQRMDRIREGSITDDQAGRYRKLRTEVIAATSR